MTAKPMEKPKPTTERRAWWKTPLTPNFIQTKDDAGVVAVEFLHDSDLRRIARAWTAELLAKARKRRTRKAESGR